MKHALVTCLTLALVAAAPAVADHGGKHFISKKRAKTLIRQTVHEDARRENYKLTRLRLSDCRYGRTEWGRRRWLCDLRMETWEGRPITYCGWGRVVKRRKPDVGFRAHRWLCY